MDRSEIDAVVVRELLARQFPDWADLAIRPVETNGWDNTTFRLGDSLLVRLPNGDNYALQVDKEHRWLPLLAPELPLPIPAPRAKGEPDVGFPRPWSVYEWLEGSAATLAEIVDLERFAKDLAAFLKALYSLDTAGGPAPGAGSQWRGGPLHQWDGLARSALVACAGEIDTGRALGLWQRCLGRPFRGCPVWVHGDVAASNLLVTEGRLAAVIDFGCSAVGDPACDLAIAYTLFNGKSRQAFRTTLGLDQATWERGRGWVLWKALAVLQDELEGDGHYPAWHQMGWRTGAREIIDDVLN